MGVANKRTLTKARRKTRDLDQIKADLLSTRHLVQFQKTKSTEEIPGLGQNYCIECARWFQSDTALQSHCRGKPHKRSLDYFNLTLQRVRQVRQEPTPNPPTVVGHCGRFLETPSRNNGALGGVEVNIAT